MGLYCSSCVIMAHRHSFKTAPPVANSLILFTGDSSGLYSCWSDLGQSCSRNFARDNVLCLLLIWQEWLHFGTSIQQKKHCMQKLEINCSSNTTFRRLKPKQLRICFTGYFPITEFQEIYPFDTIIFFFQFQKIDLQWFSLLNSLQECALKVSIMIKLLLVTS